MFQGDVLKVKIAPEVQEALQAGTPVVALESCVLALGLPRPMNMSCAKEAMATIREVGAVPAVIAVVNGEPCVGISEAELSQLCRGKDFVKASCDDLPGMIVCRRNAATTVSASLVIAERAGIQVFTTGGLGGISIHCNQHFDASSDLLQLTRTRLAVVCSGVKSVQDIGASMECLESLGVPIALYRTDKFPGFFAPGYHISSGVTMESVEQVAAFYKISLDLLGRGVVVANPAPADKLLDREALDSALREAQVQAESDGVSGKQLTPFLMDYLARVTKGATLEANHALLLANAKLAAELACHLKG